VALSHKGTAHEVEDHKGVALWLPPGIEPDQAALAASLPVEREAELAAVFDGWLPIIRARLICTCRSSASIRRIEVKVAAQRFCGTRYASATGTTSRLISNPPTRPI